MKIFPLRPMSNLDRFINICKIMSDSASKVKNFEGDVVILDKNKPLKKGRSICNMLSE